MTKLIIALTSLIFFVVLSCDQSQTSTNETEEQEQQKEKALSIEEIEEQQLNSRIRKDTIIEGLVFGMTPKQVSNVLKKLKSEKKVNQFAPSPDGRQIAADYNIGLNDYTVTGSMDIRFYNNALFYVGIYFRENTNSVSLSTMSNDFLKLYEENLGQPQFQSGSGYYWVTGNRSVSIGSLNDPNDPFYMIEYKDTGKFKEAQNAEQENINKKKPKL